MYIYMILESFKNIARLNNYTDIIFLRLIQYWHLDVKNPLILIRDFNYKIIGVWLLNKWWNFKEISQRLDQSFQYVEEMKKSKNFN